MALEPRTVTLEDGPSLELVDMTRRFRLGGLLGLPVVLLAMGDMMLGPGLGGRVDMRAANWVGLVFATPVVWWAGWPFFMRGWASIVNRHANMFTLIALGVGAAYGFSVAATLVPQTFPDGFRMHGLVETYFDTAVVVVVLVLMGQVLELRARGQTSSAIRQLLGMAPKTARVVRGGGDVDVPIADVGYRDYLNAARNALMSGRGVRGSARQRVLAAIGLALTFGTWRSLAREQKLTDSQAADLMCRLVAAAPGR